MNKKLLVIIPLIVVVSIPVVIFAQFTLDCNSQYSTVKKAKQPLIEEFDKIALLGEQPAQKAKVDRGGDCIDSKPSVSVSKHYDTEVNGGEAVDSIRRGIKQAGYSITNENFGSEGCKLLYRVKAQNSSVKIYVVAFQKNIKDTTCTDGYPTGISEAHFRTQTIDTTDLSLKN